MDNGKLTEEEANKITGGQGIRRGDECWGCHKGHYEVANRDGQHIWFRCPSCGDTKVVWIH